MAKPIVPARRRSASSRADTGVTLKEIPKSDISLAAEVLADAFLEDPFAVWLFPSEGLRERLRASWVVQMRVISVPRGYAFATPGYEGVALWAPPGGHGPSFMQQVRMFVPFVRILGPRRLPTASAGYAAITEARPEEPHWYLSTLGVAPAHQRRGFGGALIRPMLERADADGVITHLETFKEDNVPYYERFGFRVTSEEEIPNGPRMWAMARAVAAGG